MKSRLPKALDSDPRAEDLLRGLADHAVPLWKGAAHTATRVDLGEDLVAALRSAVKAGRVIRGFEAAESKLAAEDRGLKLAPVGAHPGAAPSTIAEPARDVRISRLLLLANDGSERFYRNVDGLVRRHGSRLFALQLDVDALFLGNLLFGPESLTRLLLLEHKDAVTAALLAVATQWEGRTP